MLAPGVSLNQMFPGDPSMVELLKEAGAESPPLADAGNQPIDPYAQHARQQALAPDDPVTEQFKAYQARRNAIGDRPPPSDNIPTDQLYDTLIFAPPPL